MKTHYLDYPLREGFIDHWLVLGPYVTTDALVPGETPVPPFHLPVTPGAKVTNAGKDYFWRVETAGEDRLVERSQFSPYPERLHMWAYCRLRSPKGGTVQAALKSLNSTVIWLNGALLHRHADTGTTRFDLTLRDGNNDLLILIEADAYRESTLSLALQLSGNAVPEVSVRLPVRSEHTDYWKVVEGLYASARTGQAVFTPSDRISIQFPPDQPRGAEINFRVQGVDGRAYGDFNKEVKPGDQIQFMYAQQLNSGDYEVLLMPAPQHYYENEFRVTRRVPFQVANERYASAPQEAYEDRLILLMREAARRQQLEGEIAKFALGWWREVDQEILQTAQERVRNRAAGSALDLLLLCGILVRMSLRADFPEELRVSIEGTVAASLIGAEQEQSTEKAELMYSAARELGARYFTRTDKKIAGLNDEPALTRHREQLMGWLRDRAQNGFSDFDSDYDGLVAALAHLADLSPNLAGAAEDIADGGKTEEDDFDESLPDLAAVLLDKVLFTLALHTWRGVLAVPQARAHAGWLRSGRLNPASAIAYLTWGTGSITNRMAGAVSLGLCRNYQVPNLLRAIALDTRDQWNLERVRAAEGEVNRSFFKTADFALASLQDYRPGQSGDWTHAWQATLGSEALVFTNHPAALQFSDHRPKGYWAGSESLPRIAQWQDALICLYNLPAEAWLPFTHAYFPTAAFDEYRFEGGWAFARKGDGYLALFAAPGFQFVEDSEEAGREIRAYGQQSAWLCQMGRQSVDGTFDAFIQLVRAHPPQVDGLHVKWQTLRGKQMSFDWTGPLRIDGQEHSLGGFPHFDTPFARADHPVKTLHIQLGDDAIHLDFQ